VLFATKEKSQNNFVGVSLDDSGVLAVLAIPHRVNVRCGKLCDVRIERSFRKQRWGTPYDKRFITQRDKAGAVFPPTHVVADGIKELLDLADILRLMHVLAQRTLDDLCVRRSLK
jgi:hypothetical protein